MNLPFFSGLKVFVLLLIAGSAGAQAPIYRCVDAEDKVSFQAQPCAAVAPQSSAAEVPSMPAPALGLLRFDLISIDGHRLAWTSAGPRDSTSSVGNVLGNGAKTRLRTYAVALRDDDGEAYALESNGDLLKWFPRGIDGPSQPVEIPSNLPALSDGTGTAWDTKKDVLAVVSGGTNGYFYRYDTSNHRWLDAHALKYQSVMSVAHNEQTGGYAAISSKVELLIFNENAELVDVRPLAKVLPELNGAYGLGAGASEGMMVVAQGDTVALINVRDANVTHIWTYGLASRQAQLSYKMPGLRKPSNAGAVPVPQAASTPSPAVALIAWPEQLFRLLSEPASSVLSKGTATTEAGFYLTALISLAILLLLVARHSINPVRSRPWKVVWWLVALGLVVLPILLIYAGRPRGQDLLLGPTQVWAALQAFIDALQRQLPLAHVFSPVARFSLMATGACAMAVLVLGVLLFSPRRNGVLMLAVGIILVLAVAPAKYLADNFTGTKALAEERAEGMALFDAKCRSAGVRRLDAVGGVDGIRLTGLRGEASSAAFSDPDWPDAGVPDDLVGMDYIKSFLDSQVHDGRGDPAGSVPGVPGNVARMGYQYVDVLLANGTYLRYSLGSSSAGSAKKGVLATERVAAAQAARYAVSYVRNDSPQDRVHWVAGATITVSDTRTGRVMAEAKTFSHAPPERLGVGHLNLRNWRGAMTCLSYGEASGISVPTFAEEIVQRPPR